MKINQFVIAAAAVSLALPAGLMGAKANAAEPAQPAAGFYQERPWDEPPGEFREYQKKGFHDGVEAARKDFDKHHSPDPESHDDFRHPHAPRDMRDDYRDGFRHGYEAAMHHLMGGHDHDHDHDHY